MNLVRAAALFVAGIGVGALSVGGGAMLLSDAARHADRGEFTPLPDPAAYARAVDAVFSDMPGRAATLRRLLRETILASGLEVRAADAPVHRAFLEGFDETGRVTASGADSVVLATRLYGLRARGLWLRAPGNGDGDGAGRSLLIYHSGHQGNPLADDAVLRLLEATLGRGVDMLVLTMIGFGFNAAPEATIPTRLGEVRVPARFPLNHDVFALFHDAANPGRTGAGILLSGNQAILRKAIAEGNYDRVIMAGLSGGGWATTFYAAMNPVIDRSLSFGGTVPMLLRTAPKNIGDYEQHADPLFRHLGYWDLYTLATLDAAGRATREHRQIYNSADPCCFDGTSARVIREIYADTRKQPGLTFELVESDRHEMHPEIILEALGDTPSGT